jgi:hypothetical protein
MSKRIHKLKKNLTPGKGIRNNEEEEEEEEEEEDCTRLVVSLMVIQVVFQ